MKKQNRTNYLIILLLLLCALLTACDKEHNHSYGEWQITHTVTCVENGERVCRCECGDTKTEVIYPNGHNYVNGICTDCGVAE